MKNLAITIVGAFSLFSFVAVQAGLWSLDGAHSRLGFTIVHNGITNVHGNFTKFTMEVTTPNEDFNGATIELNAESSSVNTGIDARDNHLRTADCFDVEKYPNIIFKSNSVKETQTKGTYAIEGDLTMHGVTKKVFFNGIHTGNSKNHRGATVAGLHITGAILRSEFGMGQVSPGLSDEVNLVADLEIVQN